MCAGAADPHHVHCVLMGHPYKVGTKSHLVESPQDWVDRVSLQQHFDPGWAGKEAVIAPGGNVEYEHAWSQTQMGRHVAHPWLRAAAQFRGSGQSRVRRSILLHKSRKAVEPCLNGAIQQLISA